MASLYLSDLFARAGIDPKKVMLIRHSLNNVEFKKCYDMGMTYEYTKHQIHSFANGAEYWMVFISDKGTTAKFHAIYKVNGQPQVCDRSLAIPGFPYQEWYDNKNCSIHSIDRTDIMQDLQNRLIIDWGKGTVVWSQWGTNEKEVLCIQDNQKKRFDGFENIILPYDELKEIIEDSVLYENWHSAMRSVYAVYLISDKKDGALYVGSAYADNGGLLARWSYYVATHHGDNKEMKEKLIQFPDRYHDFQFSILQILPSTMVNSDVIKIESLWKNKLLSKEFGMNAN